MFRVGKVVAVDEKTAKARVELEDADKVISYWLPVLHHKTQDDKFYWLPDLNELVLVGFLDYGIEQGFVLGAIYNEKDTPPIVDKDKIHIRFKDGTTIEYDRNTHKLLIHSVGDIEIISDTHIIMKAPRIDLNP